MFLLVDERHRKSFNAPRIKNQTFLDRVKNGFSKQKHRAINNTALVNI